MKRTLMIKLIAAATVAGATLGLAPAAQARTDVQVSIGLPGLPDLPGLPFFGQPRPAPIYYEPEPVYARPRPVYGPPAVVYERPHRPSYRAEYEYERQRPWQHGDWQRREWEHRHQDSYRYAPPDRRWRD